MRYSSVDEDLARVGLLKDDKNKSIFSSVDDDLIRAGLIEDPNKSKPGFISDVKRGTGQIISSVGSTLRDLGPEETGKSIEEYGNKITRRNPSAINTVDEALSNPFTTVREAVGEVIPQVGVSGALGVLGGIGGGALGSFLGPGGTAAGAIAGRAAAIAAGRTIGGAVSAFGGNLIQEYGGIRSEQRESGNNDIARALGTGAFAAGIDTLSGAERITNKVLGKGASILERDVGKKLLPHVAKQGALGFAEEAGTEVLQTGLERVGAFKDLTGADAYNEYGLAAIKGGIGGGVIRGGIAGVAGQKRPEIASEEEGIKQAINVTPPVLSTQDFLRQTLGIKDADQINESLGIQNKTEKEINDQRKQREQDIIAALNENSGRTGQDENGHEKPLSAYEVALNYAMELKRQQIKINEGAGLPTQELINQNTGIPNSVSNLKQKQKDLAAALNAPSGQFVSNPSNGHERELTFGELLELNEKETQRQQPQQNQPNTPAVLTGTPEGTVLQTESERVARENFLQRQKEAQVAKETQEKAAEQARIEAANKYGGVETIIPATTESPKDGHWKFLNKDYYNIDDLHKAVEKIVQIESEKSQSVKDIESALQKGGTPLAPSALRTLAGKYTGNTLEKTLYNLNSQIQSLVSKGKEANDANLSRLAYAYQTLSGKEAPAYSQTQVTKGEKDGKQSEQQQVPTRVGDVPVTGRATETGNGNLGLLQSPSLRPIESGSNNDITNSQQDVGSGESGTRDNASGAVTSTNDDQQKKTQRVTNEQPAAESTTPTSDATGTPSTDGQPAANGGTDEVSGSKTAEVISRSSPEFLDKVREAFEQENNTPEGMRWRNETGLDYAHLIPDLKTKWARALATGNITPSFIKNMLDDFDETQDIAAMLADRLVTESNRTIKGALPRLKTLFAYLVTFPKDQQQPKGVLAQWFNVSQNDVTNWRKSAYKLVDADGNIKEGWSETSTKLLRDAIDDIKAKTGIKTDEEFKAALRASKEKIEATMDYKSAEIKELTTQTVLETNSKGEEGETDVGLIESNRKNMSVNEQYNKGEKVTTEGTKIQASINKLEAQLKIIEDNIAKAEENGDNEAYDTLSLTRDDIESDLALKKIELEKIEIEAKKAQKASVSTNLSKKGTEKVLQEKTEDKKESKPEKTTKTKKETKNQVAVVKTEKPKKITFKSVKEAIQEAYIQGDITGPQQYDLDLLIKNKGLSASELMVVFQKAKDDTAGVGSASVKTNSLAGALKAAGIDKYAGDGKNGPVTVITDNSRTIEGEAKEISITELALALFDQDVAAGYDPYQPSDWSMGKNRPAKFENNIEWLRSLISESPRLASAVVQGYPVKTIKEVKSKLTDNSRTIEGEARVVSMTDEQTVLLTDQTNKLTDGQNKRLEEFYKVKRGTPEFIARVKADVLTFANEGAKAVAGAVRDIIRQIANGVMSVAIIFNPGFVSDPIKFAVPTYETRTEQVVEKAPVEAAKNMSPAAQRAYEVIFPAIKENLATSNKFFIVTDKPTATQFIFNPDGSLLFQSKVLVGKSVGDFLKGNNNIDANKITPAGLMTLVMRENTSSTKGYDFNTVFGVEGVDNGEKYFTTLMHSVWLNEKDAAQRQKALLEAGPGNSRYSFGCINTDKDTFGKLLKDHKEQMNGAMLFVVPDNQESVMEFVNGKAVFEKDITRQGVTPKTKTVVEKNPPWHPGVSKSTQLTGRVEKSDVQFSVAGGNRGPIVYEKGAFIPGNTREDLPKASVHFTEIVPSNRFYEAFYEDFPQFSEGSMDGSIFVHSFNVNGPRNTGLGKQILNATTEWADKNNKTIFLIPAASPDSKLGGLTQEQLVAWYARNGFVQDGDAMIRKPNNSQFSKTAKVTNPEQASVANKELKAFIGDISSARLEVVQSINGLPAHIQDIVHQKQMLDGSIVQALVYKNKAYMIADNIEKGTTRAVFMHEVGAHLGLEKLLSPKQYAKLVDTLDSWVAKNDGSVESDLASKAFTRSLESKETGEKRTKEFVAYFIEEAVNAGINPTAVDYKTGTGRWFIALWAAFKNAIRKLGFNPDKMNAEDVVNLAYGAARLEVHGNWHGTANAFRKFNHDYMGSGEGNQAFGWGTYLAQRLGIGRDYMGIAIKANTKKLDIGYNGKSVNELVEKRRRTSDSFFFVEALLSIKSELTADPNLDIEAAIKEAIDTAKIALPSNKSELQEYEKELHQILYADVNPYKTEALRDYMEEETKYFIDELKEKIEAKEKIIEHLKKLNPKDISIIPAVNPKGYLLRVDTNVKDEELLDLDKPLNQQSALVKKALKKIPQVEYADDAWTGRDFYDFLAKDLFGNKPVKTKADKMGDIKGASMLLDSVGIKGNIYLDLPSRDINAPRNLQTRNKVIFNDDNIFKIATLPQASIDDIQFSIAQPINTIRQAAQSRIDSLPPAYRGPVHAIFDTIENIAKKGAIMASFTEDLASVAKKYIPSVVKYVALMKERSAIKTMRERRVDDILTEYQSLDKSIKGIGAGTVNAFLMKSTMEKKWAYQPSWLKDPVTIDPEMKKQFDELVAKDKKAGDLIKKVFEHGFTDLTDMKESIQTNISIEYDALIKQAETEGNDKEVTDLQKKKADELRDFRSLLGIQANLPYAPLKRFGNYVVVGKSEKYLEAEKQNDRALIKKLESDGNEYFVQFADTWAEAKAISRSQEGKYALVEPFEKDTAQRAMYGGKDVNDVFERLRTLADESLEGGGAKSKKAVDSLLLSLKLSLLSQHSARQAENHRRNIAGAEEDMMRSFATQGRANAHFISSLHNTDKIYDQLRAMKEEADASTEGRGERRRYYNEFMKRHSMGFNYQSNPLMDKALGITSLWMLLSSPAHFLQNATQPFMMSMPVIAGKHGEGNTFKAMLQAYKEIGSLIRSEGLTEKTYAKLPADVREAIETLVNSGRIDISLESDLGAWKSDESKNVASIAIEKLRRISQDIESINRVVTAVAAYRLEKASGKTKEEAVAYADQIILDTHGDYSGFNAPRFTRQGLGRLMTQFRKFQLIQISLIAKLGHQAFKGASSDERAVGRKALAFTLGHTFAAAGVMGMPGFAAIAWIIGKVFGDDDEPDNPEATLRKMIGDDSLADLLLKGVPKLTGVDLSGKLGMGQMLSLLPYTELDLTRDGYARAVTAAMGPFIGGLVPKAVDGVGLMTQGNYYKGLEAIAPKGIADALKSVELANKGITQRNGDVVLSTDDIGVLDVMSQALGLPTNTITDKQFIRNAEYQSAKFYKERSTDLKTDYVRAFREGDTETMADIREKWEATQVARVRNGEKRQPISDLFRAPQEQVKREKNIKGGIAKPSLASGITER